MKFTLKNGFETTILGIPVYVRASYLAILLIWVLLGSGSLACVHLFIILAFLLPHGMGHIYASRLVGWKDHGIILHLFGGSEVIEIKANEPKNEFIVAIAGPLVTAAIILILSGFYVLFESPWLRLFAIINVSLLIFNLLPTFPMDGGRILRSFLSLFIEDPRKRTKVVCVICACIFYFIITGILSDLLIAWIYSQNPIIPFVLFNKVMICFIGILMPLMSFHEYKHVCEEYDSDTFNRVRVELREGKYNEIDLLQRVNTIENKYLKEELLYEIDEIKKCQRSFTIHFGEKEDVSTIKEGR